jgi:hypothetical protein
MDKTRIKKQIFTHIPVYSGDVSGAASALYEFGGITVIHDPSGCNSTYNTFDELRWTKRESAIYISGLRESDAIHGNDNRLIDDTCDAVAALSKKPEFIAVCNSPVPDIIGTDFTAICHIIEEQTGIPAFYIQTNAMHDYTVGGANAFLAIAEKFLDEDETSSGSIHDISDLKMSDKQEVISSNRIHDKSFQKDSSLSINLLGLSPFEYPSDKQVDKLYDILQDAGFSIAANWGRGTAAHHVSFTDVKVAASADVSLVLSSIGLKAAQFLYERFGIPYVIGNPLVSDEFASIVFKDLKALEVKNSYLDYLGKFSNIPSQPDKDSSDDLISRSVDFSGSQSELKEQISAENITTPEPGFTAFIGEPVTMGSEAAALKLSSPETPVALICTTELTDSLVSTVKPTSASAGTTEPASLPSSTTEKNSFLILCPRGEAEIAEALKKAAVIHGDPLFRNAYSNGTPGFDPAHQTWIDEPHLAMSGRLFADKLI